MPDQPMLGNPAMDTPLPPVHEPTSLRDVKRYRGYLPLKMEKESVLSWLGKIIGPPWLDKLWLDKYSSMHITRYRFGDINEIQFYLKDKTWRPMPIDLWLQATSLSPSLLGQRFWDWVRAEREWSGAAAYDGQRRRFVRATPSRGGLL